jgi:hypothetical protein
MSLDAAPAPSHAPEDRRVSVWVKLFVLFHLAAITSYSLPNAPKYMEDKKQPLALDTTNVRTTLKSLGANISDGTLYYNQHFIKPSPLKYYSMFTGFWQFWDMFSPNPASIDFYGTAEITYKDGSTSPYTYPRMYDMSIPEKYVNERYRKFYERAHLEQFRWEWPIFAQRVALVNFTNLRNPPVEVKLTRHWIFVAPPGKSQKPDYSSYTYFTYKVDQAKLLHDKENP